MKWLLTAALVVGFLGCQSHGGKDVKLDTKDDKVSYSIGLSIGKSLSRDSVAIKPEAFLRGVTDAWVDTSKHLMTEQQIQETMTEFQQEIRTKQMERAHAMGDKNAKDGAEFLAENAKKPGVVTLPSGLQYKIITPGKGKKPTAKSVVTTNYTGRLIDGTEFDSSFRHGQPATFPVDHVIKGWTEALQLMNVGSKWELTIPSDLAYGPQGAGNGAIPPNATLVFEIELLSVK